MSKIDEWEKEAQPESHRINCPDGLPGCLVAHFSIDKFDTPEKKKIRALIDLIRKKDEALKYYTKDFDGMRNNEIAIKAIALTDELK